MLKAGDFAKSHNCATWSYDVDVPASLCDITSLKLPVGVIETLAHALRWPCWHGKEVRDMASLIFSA